jgi:hypothetical protein
VKQRLLHLARMAWAMPCSVVGLLLAAAALLLGGSARRVGHTIEVGLARRQQQAPRCAARLPFLAITFGHVIIGQSHEALATLRAHEGEHVRQYEQLGLLFFVAYPASSLIAWLRGRCPYRDNRFEREAFAAESRSAR